MKAKDVVVGGAYLARTAQHFPDRGGEKVTILDAPIAPRLPSWVVNDHPHNHPRRGARTHARVRIETQRTEYGPRAGEEITLPLAQVVRPWNTEDEDSLADFNVKLARIARLQGRFAALGLPAAVTRGGVAMSHDTAETMLDAYEANLEEHGITDHLGGDDDPPA